MAVGVRRSPAPRRDGRTRRTSRPAWCRRRRPRAPHVGPPAAPRRTRCSSCDDAHALAATTRGRLDQHRVVEAPQGRPRGRTTGRRGPRPSTATSRAASLRPIRSITADARTDEHQPGGLDRRGEGGALGEEAVAGVDRLGAASRARPRRRRRRRGRSRSARPRRPDARAARCASRSEWTAIVWMPSARAVRITRQAISPRLAIRSRRIITTPSHPPDAVAGLRDRGVRGHRERHAQHPPCLERVDDAVVPEPGGRVVRRALVLVLLADRLP